MVKNNIKREENRKLNNKWNKLAKHYNTKYIKADLKPMYFKKVILNLWMILNNLNPLASLLCLTKVDNFSYFKNCPYYYKCHCNWCSNDSKRNEFSTRVNLNIDLEDL